MKYLLIDNTELVLVEALSFQIYSKEQPRPKKSYLRIELRNGVAYEYEIKDRPLKDEEKTELFKVLVRLLNSRTNPVTTEHILSAFKDYFLKESMKSEKKRGRKRV